MKRKITGWKADFPIRQSVEDFAGKQRKFVINCHEGGLGYTVRASEEGKDGLGYQFAACSETSPYNVLGRGLMVNGRRSDVLPRIEVEIQRLDSGHRPCCAAVSWPQPEPIDASRYAVSAGIRGASRVLDAHPRGAWSEPAGTSPVRVEGAG